jgi:hypothetical protein
MPKTNEEKLDLQIMAALLIARETVKPLNLVAKDLKHWIDKYHATA